MPLPKRRLPVPRVPSARERIEVFPELREKEMSWYKSRPGDLREAAFLREKDRVHTFSPKKGDKSEIHTHRVFGYISPADLNGFLQELCFTDVRKMHVVSIGKGAVVKGYFSIHATKRLVQKQAKAFFDKTHELSILKKKLYGMERSFTSYSQMLPIIEMLQQKKLIKVKITPMKGYRFDKKTGLFVPE